MNYQVLSGVTAAILATSFGTDLSAQKAIAGVVNDSQVNAITTVSSPVAQESSLTAIANEADNIATVHAYSLEGSTAATMYVRNLPVLTFLSDSEEDLQAQSTIETDPVVRAQMVADRLNSLSSQDVVAEKIAVNWQADTKSYQVTVDGQELVAIDDSTILADTTKNTSEDALQVAERLRTLLSNGSALTETAQDSKLVASLPQATKQGVKGGARGMASWYGPGFHGRRSASGEIYNQNAMTAAHKTLPFGTRVRVTNLNNGRSVIVRINDRGPYAGGRIIDLSAAAARSIGMINSGVAPVSVQILGR